MTKTRNKHGLSAVSGAKVILYLLIIRILLASSASCASETITLGVSLGLTGKYSIMSKIQEKGYRLWVNDTNKAGGILGREVKLLVVDDQSSAQKAISAYKNFIFSEKVDLLFAPFSSEITKAVMPIAEKSHYPIIAAGAASDSLWQAGYKYIFGVFTPASKITVSFLEMLVMNGVDNLSIFYTQNPFSKDTAKGCIKWAKRFGLTIKHIEPFDESNVNYATLTETAIKTKSDVVIMCGHLNESIKMKQAMDSAGWQPKVYYSPQGPNQRYFKERLQDSANYVFGTAQWEYCGGIIKPETQKFLKSYQHAYKNSPSNFFAVTAYSAGQIIERAISTTGSLNRKKLRDAIANMDFNCLLGRFKVDRKGRPVKNFTLVFQIQDLQTEAVWPPGLMTAQPIFQ